MMETEAILLSFLWVAIIAIVAVLLIITGPKK
jgi:signal transduction histidine kinase